MAVLIRTMQEDSYYWFRERFLRSELEFAKLVNFPRWKPLPARLRINNHLLRPSRRWNSQGKSEGGDRQLGNRFFVQRMLPFSAPLVEYKVENDQRRQPERYRSDDPCA